MVTNPGQPYTASKVNIIAPKLQMMAILVGSTKLWTYIVVG